MACNLSSSKGAAYTRSYITVWRHHHRRCRCAPRPRKGTGKGQALEGMQVCEDRVYTHVCCWVRPAALSPSAQNARGVPWGKMVTAGRPAPSSAQSPPRLQEGERTSAQNAARHTIRSSGGETALASFAPHIGYYSSHWLLLFSLSSPSRSLVARL